MTGLEILTQLREQGIARPSAPACACNPVGRCLVDAEGEKPRGHQHPPEDMEAREQDGKRTGAAKPGETPEEHAAREASGLIG